MAARLGNLSHGHATELPTLVLPRRSPVLITRHTASEQLLGFRDPCKCHVESGPCELLTGLKAGPLGPTCNLGPHLEDKSTKLYTLCLTNWMHVLGAICMSTSTTNGNLSHPSSDSPAGDLIRECSIIGLTSGDTCAWEGMVPPIQSWPNIFLLGYLSSDRGPRVVHHTARLGRPSRARVTKVYSQTGTRPTVHELAC